MMTMIALTAIGGSLGSSGTGQVCRRSLNLQTGELTPTLARQLQPSLDWSAVRKLLFRPLPNQPQ